MTGKTYRWSNTDVFKDEKSDIHIVIYFNVYEEDIDTGEIVKITNIFLVSEQKKGRDVKITTINSDNTTRNIKRDDYQSIHHFICMCEELKSESKNDIVRINLLSEIIEYCTQLVYEDFDQTPECYVQSINIDNYNNIVAKTNYGNIVFLNRYYMKTHIVLFSETKFNNKIDLLYLFVDYRRVEDHEKQYLKQILNYITFKLK